MRWFEGLCSGRGGRAGWLNGHDVAGGTLSGNERPWGMVCSLETWNAMMIKANTPIVVRIFSVIEIPVFTNVSLSSSGSIFQAFLCLEIRTRTSYFIFLEICTPNSSHSLKI